MNADELKEYIIDNNCIVQILESLDCHGIKEYSDEYRAALPEGTNKTAVCIKKKNLSSSIRSGDGNKYGDIFSFVMNIKGCSFGSANQFIHNVLGLQYTYRKSKEEVQRVDPLAIFKKAKRKRYVVNDIDINTYDDSFMKEYVQLPHISWVREGILPFVCKKFNIGYSFNKKRITIPWRWWCGNGNEYLGVIGRTTIGNYEMFDIPKYFGLIPFSKGMDVYGLNENYKDIQENGYVVVFEAEKSVLKRASRLDNTGTAIGNCELTDMQVKILISLNVEIILAFDEGLSIDHIRKECEKFYGIRPVSYIYDKWGLIEKGSKDSPADKPNKVYNFLFNHRFKYDELEHKKYLADLEKGK